ncbi:cellulose binding domain-containing protein [Streptomyces drozdowiczii]|uniref:Cellulose binding domain-containing protein n=1 Tax=Streptomyces drozdowiczii TaxID=202862 RepID=A0ABY6Q149_9ACTN|nr:cellulose binding domain-containing protein [Streptomyces drozdowiczii]MCX0242110.1 cellulose binding domain-containing protein [Streptomyces drozdowiczii]UZK57801.1 cellulose binding domain-containing protein [Streptomyces drozdowiczii]
MAPTHRPPRGFRPLARASAVLAASLAVLASLTVAAPAAPQAATDADADVQVNAQAALGTLTGAARGVNTAIWDAHMNDPEVADLMTAADVGAMRYPGGSYADIYHWETHTAPGGYVAPGTGFDAFMGTVRAAGAQPILIANYGSGTPEEAADWVRYANVTKKYGAKYWEIGNEIYGNGHYGSGWENDEHADKSPREYAREVRAYAAAMKAVDPTVKIGAVLTSPGEWPDGVVGDGDSGDWNHTVLPAVADVIDFVSVHWYAGGSDTTADAALSRLAKLPGELREVRNQIDRAAGARSPGIGIALTEINTNTGGARLTARPNGLFAADAFMTALENGVFNVDWWNTHNGGGEITTVDGETDYGDMGMLSSGACTGDVCEPAPNTPFHPYYGMKMTARLGTAGDTMVAAQSSAQDVSAHAVLRDDGRLSVMLVNKNPDTARTVALDYAGFTPSAAAPEVSRYARGDSDITEVTGGDASASRVTVPPYGLLTVTLAPKAGTGPAASAASTPGAPRLDAVTDTTARLTWNGATGATRYLVQERDGAHTRLIGETTGTSVTLRNLPPGSTHTVNVLATDSAGRPSGPSSPLTFTTGTPADAVCSVTYHRDSSWGNGFVTTVTVRNLASTPITGWTVDWDWPTTGQSVDSGWNATFHQTGSHVRVTAPDGAGPLAPDGGSTASFGFVGANDGPNPDPAVFRLNGAVCSGG